MDGFILLSYEMKWTPVGEKESEVCIKWDGARGKHREKETENNSFLFCGCLSPNGKEMRTS